MAPKGCEGIEMSCSSCMSDEDAAYGFLCEDDAFEKEEERVEEEEEEEEEEEDVDWEDDDGNMNHYDTDVTPLSFPQHHHPRA